MSAICAGQLGGSENDVLVVGTPTTLLAYNVQDNTDVFYKDVSESDGAVQQSSSFPGSLG